MIPNSMSIAIAEARSAAESADGSLEDRLRAAFAVTRNHWMVVNDDERFRSGIGGVLTAINTTEDEKARIESELASLKALSAAMTGVPVDFEAVSAGDRPEPIGMAGIWRETAK